MGTSQKTKCNWSKQSLIDTPLCYFCKLLINKKVPITFLLSRETCEPLCCWYTACVKKKMHWYNSAKHIIIRVPNYYSLKKKKSIKLLNLGVLGAVVYIMIQNRGKYILFFRAGVNIF